MNQILFTGDKQPNSSINNIIRVFCIIVIVFSIFFIIQGTYALVKNKDEKSIIKNDMPNITIETQGGNAIISVKHNKSISKVLYSWDNGEAMQIDAQDKTEINETVVVPNGDCTLNISVIDSNKIEYRKQFKIEFDPSIDMVLPEINISAVPGKITIEAEDNVEMAYIIYKWNDEQEVKVEVSGEEHKKIIKEIEVKKGFNVLNVTATDKAGNTKQYNQEIIGTSKPKVSVGKSGSDLIIKVTDEDEVTKVEYDFNGTIDTKENTEQNKKQFEFKLKMKKGENVILIKAYNKSGLVQEFAGKTTY